MKMLFLPLMTILAAGYFAGQYLRDTAPCKTWAGWSHHHHLFQSSCHCLVPSAFCTNVKYATEKYGSVVFYSKITSMTIEIRNEIGNTVNGECQFTEECQCQFLPCPAMPILPMPSNGKNYRIWFALACNNQALVHDDNNDCSHVPF